MFHKLSTRITVMYGGLFSAALLIMSVVVYFAVLDHAQRNVRSEMSANSLVFQRLWALKSDSQATNASLLARDFGFKAAIATRDQATVASAFDNLKRRVNADTGAVIAADGTSLTTGSEDIIADLSTVLNAQDTLDTHAGIIRIKDQAYSAVAAPVLSPDLMGWVVFGTKLDHKELKSLESLSSIPITASVITRIKGGEWRGHSETDDGFNPGHLGMFIGSHLSDRTAGMLNTTKGLMITVATPLPSLDASQESVLLLSYPLNAALAAYQPLLTLLMIMGGLALVLIVLASLYLARSLTQPIRSLTDAAGLLQSGRTQLVTIESDDEMADLARAFNNMALAIEDRESRILHLARHDVSSNLPNRQALEDHLDVLFASPGDRTIMAFAIGIERFSHLRAVWGAATANGVFEVLARQLLNEYPDARIARLNTDTLGFVIPHTDLSVAKSTAPAIAKALATCLDNRFIVNERSLDIMVSIGFAVTGKQSNTGAERLERAIIALDQCRAAKLKTLAFSTIIYDTLSDNLKLTEQLHSALERHEMSVHYQPKYNYRTERLDGAEALVRWNHAERGMVSPLRFVLIAEETGYIGELTLQVMKTVIEDQARLKANGFEIDMSINYSGKLLSDEAFIDKTLELMATRCGKICLEITETAVIEDPIIGLKAIDRFIAAGLDMSIDDFGTGLSSLSYLKMIPAYELKIDQSFIQDIEHSQKDALLVRSTIDLGHGLGMKITAEGVESEHSLALLASMGCDMAQGYGIARPMAFGPYQDFLKLKHAEGLNTGLGKTTLQAGKRRKETS